MARTLVIYNTPCLCCDGIDKEMVKIDPMPFCKICAEKLFLSDPEVYNSKTGKVDSNSKVYKEWLKKYKESWADL